MIPMTPQTWILVTLLPPSHPSQERSKTLYHDIQKWHYALTLVWSLKEVLRNVLPYGIQIWKFINPPQNQWFEFLNPKFTKKSKRRWWGPSRSSFEYATSKPTYPFKAQGSQEHLFLDQKCLGTLEQNIGRFNQKLARLCAPFGTRRWRDDWQLCPLSLSFKMLGIQ